jgi:hypothetical protein
LVYQPTGEREIPVVGHQERGLRIFQHVTDPWVGIGGIQRHNNFASLQTAKSPAIAAAPCSKSTAMGSRPSPHFDKIARTIRLVQLVIGQLGVLRFDGQPFGELADHFCESSGNRLLDLLLLEFDKGPRRVKTLRPNGLLIERSFKFFRSGYRSPIYSLSWGNARSRVIG